MDIKEVVMFQRTAHYCFPRFQYRFGETFKAVMTYYPFDVLWRWQDYVLREIRFFLIFKWYKGRFNKGVLKLCHGMIDKVIKDKDMAQQLKPKFQLGCKRILISDEYYKCMNEDNFKLEASGIQQFTENGIQCKDGHHDLDVIIYATGFDLAANYDWLLKEMVLRRFSLKR